MTPYRHRSSRNAYSREKSRNRSRSRSPRRRSRYSDSRSRSYSPRERKSYDRRKSYSRSPLSERKDIIFGLSVYTTEQQINEIFSKFGPIERIQIVIDAK